MDLVTGKRKIINNLQTFVKIDFFQAALFESMMLDSSNTVREIDLLHSLRKRIWRNENRSLLERHLVRAAIKTHSRKALSDGFIQNMIVPMVRSISCIKHISYAAVILGKNNVLHILWNIDFLNRGSKAVLR